MAPIFVLGNQRSGTSAIAGLLGRTCGLSVALDMLMEVSRPRIDLVTRGALTFGAWVHENRWEFSHDVVKEPNLTFLVPELVRAFPKSRVVFIVRDPRDNIRSLLNAMGIPGDLEALEKARTRGLYPGWSLVLDGHWCGIECENYIDQLAARWAHATARYLERREEFILCRYEDFRADKLGELTRLAEALERPVVNDVSEELDRQFQVRGDRDAQWDEFFGTANLARIGRICAEGMQALGYEAAQR
jgi:hypothetical protein